MVEVRARFDPAAHLSKQGWKGKGSALKHGHSTRPLAVVQKKTLSGIGKDRDEAVPFWDHIFAATAASIQSSSGTSTPPQGVASSSSSPIPTGSSSWATGGSVNSAQNSGRGLSVSARKGKETARRGLYSRFLKGVTIAPEETTFENLVRTEEIPEQGVDDDDDDGAGSGVPGETTGKKRKRKREKGDRGEGEEVVEKKVEVESKEDKKARRAEKARRRAEKELRRKRKAEEKVAAKSSVAEEAVKADKAARKEKKVKKRREAD